MILEFDPSDYDRLRTHIRIGGQAEAMVYTADSHLLAILGRLFMRLMSWFSYAY